MQNFFLFLRRIFSFFQRHALWFLLLFLISASSFFAFREFYYFGTVHLYIPEKQTYVYVDGKKYECEKTFCAFKIPPGKYSFSVEKKGFQSDKFLIDISLQETKEYISSLKKNEVSLLTAAPKDISFSGVTFPIEQSAVSPLVPFLLIEENILKYKQNEVLDFSSPIFVSTDEVGRRAWVVSEKLVSEFLFSEKTFHPVLQETIQKFVPLGDDFFAFQAVDGSWFSFFEGVQKPLHFAPYSEKTFCARSSKTFVFLRYDSGYPALFEHDVDSSMSNKLNTFQNLMLSDTVFLKCSNDTVFVTVDEETAFTLSF